MRLHVCHGRNSMVHAPVHHEQLCVPPLPQRIRSTLLIMNCFALAGDAAFPLMPPRLVPECGKYGGCDGHFTFVDTMASLGGIGGWRGRAHPGKVRRQLA